jgi:7-carboxy-7-deazaguanine synthase
MKISEIFGPTIQGEGAAAGRHCLFVRLSLCNLECNFCDTPYTWAFTEEKASKMNKPRVFDRESWQDEMTPAEVLDALAKLWPIYDKPTLIVISGGEPMMQQTDLVVLSAMLATWGHQIHIETAGTIKPTPELNLRVTQYNVSPKLEHSGNPLNKRYKPFILADFVRTGKAWFKYVMTSEEDFAEIDAQVAEVGIPANRVMVMPEGTSPKRTIEVARTIINGAQERGYGLSFRSHVLIWGDKRGH